MWRRGRGVAPPEPWPSRVDAFLTACAMFAGQRENDFAEFVRGFGEGAMEAVRDRKGG